MGKLSDLIRINDPKVLGVDASTNSFAFCIIQNGKAIKFGEINFIGATIYDRILDARKKIRSLKATGIFDVDYITLESAVVVRSVGTGIKMAYVFGAIMGELMDDDAKIIEVNPIEWQSFIGNKNFNKSQKELIKKEFPDKSDTWIKNKIRERRKMITIDFVKSLGVNTENNNVADAAGIAWFSYNKIGSR
jgi:Holliday junction resolvasome RuvABC endonuclease subunit